MTMFTLFLVVLNTHPPKNPKKLHIITKHFIKLKHGVARES